MKNVRMSCTKDIGHNEASLLKNMVKSYCTLHCSGDAFLARLKYLALLRLSSSMWGKHDGVLTVHRLTNGTLSV